MDPRGLRDNIWSRSSLALAVAAILIFSGFIIPFGNVAAITLSDIEDAKSPQLAISDAGDIYAIWQDLTPGNYDIFLEKSTDNGAIFSDAVSISENDGDSIEPQIGISNTLDEIYILWQESGDLLFAKSIDLVLLNFTLPQIIVDSSDAETARMVVADGDLTSSIYVVWQDSGDILFTQSTNGGLTFSEPEIIVDSSSAANPQLAVSGNDIVVAWEESGEIFVITGATDGGFSGDPINVSNTSEDSLAPDIDVAGTNIFVTWQEVDSDTFPPTYEILYTVGTTSGDFGSVNNLSGNDRYSVTPSIGSSGGTKFVVWQEYDFINTDGDIFVVASTDEWDTIGCPSIIGVSTDLGSAYPQIAGDGTNVHTVWEDGSSDPNSISFNNNVDFEAPYVSLDGFIGNTAVRWEIEEDQVTVSGKVANAAEGDAVIVNWGADSPTEATISGCSWEASHVFSADAIFSNPNEITAALGVWDGSGLTETKATSAASFFVDVLAHTTSLILDPIPSVLFGSDVSVSGLLYDEDAQEGMNDQTIWFSSTGTSFGLMDETGFTAEDAGTPGVFTSTAASPDSIGNRWDVQANFDGDGLYNPSSSDIGYFNTVDPDPEVTRQYSVESTGSDVLVSFSDFGDATIEFEEITGLAAGVVYVSECSAADTPRFAVLIENDADNECIIVSPALQMAAGSSAFLSVPFTDESIPSPYSAPDVDIFLEEAVDTTYRDLTSSKILDTTPATVTALAGSFGKFIVGAAIHTAEESENIPLVRNQIFVGDGSEVNFRDITNTEDPDAILSLDSTSFETNSQPLVTVVDVDANADLEGIDQVSVTATSTNDTVGISVMLDETDINTGEFAGSFTISDTLASSQEEGILHVEDGDEISVSYERNPGARFKAIFDGVSESGLVRVTDFTIPKDSAPFKAIGGAVDVEFLDVQLESVATVTASLSYANAELGGNDPETLKLFRNDPDFGWIIIGSGIDAVDIEAKTITGQTNAVGEFSIGFCDDCSGGGGGGGLGLPGAGVVLDFIASVAISSEDSGDTDSGDGTDGGETDGSTSSGSGGGGSSRITLLSDGSSVSRQISSGENVKIVIATSSGNEIEISFESVTSSFGTVTVQETSNFEDYQDLFDSFTGERAKISIGVVGSESVTEYTTIGNIYEIEVSPTLEYSGQIWVTMPYDESLIKALGEDEANLRILHYDGGSGGGATRGRPGQGGMLQDLGWQDVTAYVDTVNNTITVALSSLSPLVATIVQDGTFDEMYFALNPLQKISVSQAILSLPAMEDAGDSTSGLIASVVNKGQQLSISGSFQNLQRSTQDFVFLVQIIDEQGYAQSISWQTGTLERGELLKPSVSWIPEENGRYTIQLFVWDSIGELGSTPSPLSNVTIKNIQVVEE